MLREPEQLAEVWAYMKVLGGDTESMFVGGRGGEASGLSTHLSRPPLLWIPSSASIFHSVASDPVSFPLPTHKWLTLLQVLRNAIACLKADRGQV